MEHTVQPSERQDPDERRRRLAMHILLLLLGLVALSFVQAAIWPQPAARQQAYWPDPTPQPVIQRHTEYNFFSKNQFLSGNNVCIGDCD